MLAVPVATVWMTDAANASAGCSGDNTAATATPVPRNAAVDAAIASAFFAGLRKGRRATTKASDVPFTAVIPHSTGVHGCVVASDIPFSDAQMHMSRKSIAPQ